MVINHRSALLTFVAVEVLCTLSATTEDTTAAGDDAPAPADEAAPVALDSTEEATEVEEAGTDPAGVVMEVDPDGKERVVVLDAGFTSCEIAPCNSLYEYE